MPEPNQRIRRAKRQQEDATVVIPESMETVLQVDPEDCIPEAETMAEVRAIQRHRARTTQATTVPSSSLPQRARMVSKTTIPVRATKDQPIRQQPPMSKSRQQQLPDTEDLPKTLPRLSRRNVLIGGSMFGTLAVLLGAQAACTAVTHFQEYSQYGEALVYRLSADVGHGGVSQFTSFVSLGCIVVIEVVGDPAQVHTFNMHIRYPDTLPHLIQLKVAPINRHGLPGKPDLLVQPENPDGSVNVSYVLYNTGSGFQLDTPTS